MAAKNECGTACRERHTYLLESCALSCTEVKGSVAHPAWAFDCPDCFAAPDDPCLRRNGSPSSIVHETRCAALDGA